jgi:glycosyltransferase involved in cell wall biosynthesis
VRLLFLCVASPYPANNGRRMRTRALLQALASEGHDLTLLTFAEPGELAGVSTAFAECCREVRCVPLTLKSVTSSIDLFARLRGLFSAKPYFVQKFASSAMRQLIREHLGRGDYDVVVCDTICSMVNLPPSPLPLLLDSVDVQHVILQRYLALEHNPAKKLYAWLEARKMRRWEEGACQMSALNLACSEYDARLLQSLAPASRVVVVPNVIDVDSYAVSADSDGLTVLYQGGMDWFPNRDAVDYFVVEILPELRKLVSGVRFVVAGRRPSDEFRGRYASMQDVEFTGTVPDMRPVIANAAVCVVPLRIASGTRLKILEAAATGKAIISTRVGAEGLDFIPGEDIVIADDPQQFARAVADLLVDVSRRHRIGEAARKRAERQYSFATLRASLRRAFAELEGISPRRRLTAPPKKQVA